MVTYADLFQFVMSGRGVEHCDLHASHSRECKAFSGPRYMGFTLQQKGISYWTSLFVEARDGDRTRSPLGRRVHPIRLVRRVLARSPKNTEISRKFPRKPDKIGLGLVLPQTSVAMSQHTVNPHKY